ncbi:MAG: acyl-CoA thioesterase [Candidatus Latescibacterota bacterium]|nr:acyl-CoA thioesterase [Candidatus Latescibacterota bacterium]RKY72223.1 MAG: acyl-CoA thioesterase [Candidatus Latescibacterota bacterium]
MAEPRDPAIRVMMLPRDTNGLGTIFGGIILSYLDLAGEIEARRHGPRRFVTVAMREVIFSAPVYVGDVVSFYARTVRVGRTSVTVQVEVEAERRHMTGEIVGVTKAEVVYVAVDETGKSIPIKDEDA